MNEIEKMYKNAGVNKKCIDKRYEKCTGVCYDCKYFIYPPFTAEKQLELIKWLSTKELKIRTNKQPYGLYIGVLGDDNTCFYGCAGIEFAQTLAELINHLWQDLTEEERKQIRDILKG